MANRAIVGIAIAVVGIVAGLLWSTRSLRATQQVTAPQAPPVCVMPVPINAYAPGAAVVRNRQSYRCVYVYGQQLVACNRKIGTSCSLVGAVYDRPHSFKCDIVGGHRPPLQKGDWSQFICYGPLVPDGLRIFLNNKVDQMDHRDRLKARGALIHGDAALLQREVIGQYGDPGFND